MMSDSLKKQNICCLTNKEKLGNASWLSITFTFSKKPWHTTDVQPSHIKDRPDEGKKSSFTSHDVILPHQMISNFLSLESRKFLDLIWLYEI